MQRTLGIDLGTTNSVMAYMTQGKPEIIINRENFSELTPSVVGLGKRSKLLVGKAAKARVVRSPHNTISSVKRFMGRKFADSDVQKALARVGYRVTEGSDGDVRVWLGEYEYSPTEISALILRRLKEEAENQLAESFTRAVITVPAYFGERQVAATREAGQMAGFHVLRIINEPTAAALAYGNNLHGAETDEVKIILVYDLGGGTFDISILMLMQGSFTVMGIEGDNLLGGDDFDRLLTERLLDEARQQEGVDLSADKRALALIHRAAENLKISLSGQEEEEVFLPSLGREAIDLELDVSRAEFEEMIRENLERTIQLTHKAIKEAHLTPDDINQILLVGGSTAIPLVEELLKNVFGEEKIRKDIHPMQCVALGAAIQSTLITEIECQNCHKQNSVHNETCTQCGEALYGSQKVMCSTCYTLSDATESTCFRCQNLLTDEPAPKKPQLRKAALKPCPNCHKPNRAGAAFCSHCRETLIDPGGRACPDCGHLNIQGAKSCSRCGTDMALELFDITPKDLGIELHDGRMSVIIPKGTNYPTNEPLSRDFSIAVTGQRRLEVPIFEGAEEMAQQNELCGLVMMKLPEGLSRGTPVNIAFGMDSDRTITIIVKVAQEEAKKIPLQRNQIDPEQRRQIEAQRERVTRFMDRWVEELHHAENDKFYQMLEQLDRALNEGAKPGQSLDSLLREVDQSVELATEVRGTDAFLSAVLSSGGKYLRPTQREELMEIQHKLVEERKQGNWTAAEAIANHATQEINQLGGPLLLIVHCRTLANQNKLSAPLKNRVYATLRQIDDGADRNKQNQITQGINNLFEMWDEIVQELEALGQPAPAITKLQG